MRVERGVTLPRWGWITRAALTAFILLPLYLRWFVYASGGCPPAALLEFFAPRLG